VRTLKDKKFKLSDIIKYKPIRVSAIKKKLLYGSREKSSILKQVLVYGLLIGIGFVYMYPLLYMAVNSLMSTSDILNPTVRWIPSSLNFRNYVIAFKVLDVGKSLTMSIVMSGVPAILQTISCSIIGYGFARFEFPLKNLWLILLVAAFIIPSQVTIIPKYILFETYKMNNTPLPSFLPAVLGQGIKSSIFILIFLQFFRSYPKVLDEAAEIDGAGKLEVFIRIALPMSIPAIVVAFLFSFVWYWNETYLSGLFFGKVIQTLPMRLQNFVDNYNILYPTPPGSTANKLNESVRMAGTMLTIVPLCVMYFILQKQFVESVDKTGITGE